MCGWVGEREGGCARARTCVCVCVCVCACKQSSASVKVCERSVEMKKRVLEMFPWEPEGYCMRGEPLYVGCLPFIAFR